MILITGATGTVGSNLVRELRTAAAPVAALVRDRGRAATRLGDNQIELRVADLALRETLRTAFAGVERMFLVAPLVPELAQLEANAIAAAAATGVRHVVKLSTAGVTQTPDGPDRLPRQYPLHRQSEERLERSGMAWTHLRPAPFMQNTLSFATGVATDGVIRGGWGNGRMAYVDARDVAAVAARVLLEDGHEQQAYELTGPEALSVAEIAGTLSRATSKPVAYHDVPPAAARNAMLQRGMPEWLAGAMAEVMAHVAAGSGATTTDKVERILGRPPRSYKAFAHEFADRF
jgi:(4-alkanoyl-5-oxo-2,5-dihydrofuran-3-yl)methyl phosphate reductase